MAYKQKANRPVIEGGTEVISYTPYSVILAGISSTDPLQYAAPGSSGNILTANNSGSAPTFQTPPIPQTNWQVLAADPGSPSVGQVWYNSTTDLYKGYKLSGTWAAKTSMNNANYGLAGSQIGSDALAFGGTVGGSPSAITELYSTSGNTWTAKTSMNTARQFLSGASLDSDNSLSFGGYTGANSAVTELYNVTGNTWTAKTSMNTARNRLMGASLSTTTALSAGGQTAGLLNTTELYDLTGNTWTAKTGMSAAHSFGSGSSINSGDAIVAGYGDATTEIYSTSGNSWSSGGSLNNSRGVGPGSAGMTSEKVLIFGGSNDGGSTWMNSTENYSYTLATWVDQGNMNTSRGDWLGGAALSSSTALSFGGYTGAASAVTELYTEANTIVTFTVT